MSSPSDFTPRQLRDRLLPPAGPHFVLDERLPVLVDFASAESTALSEAEQVQASAQAMNSALNSMRNVAKMVSDSMSGLANEPSQVDVQFGLRLDASGKAFVVESGESSIHVTLTWTPPTPALDSEPSQYSRWNTAPVDDERRWEDDDEIEAWDDEDERYWVESDRPHESSPTYEHDDDSDGYDDNYDYPARPSWSRRSPRSPWNWGRSDADNPQW